MRRRRASIRPAPSASPATTTAARVARDRVAAAPPSSDAIRRPGTARSARASTLIAFARPSAMSPPECPPQAAAHASRAAASRRPARAARRSVTSVSAPPAQPTVSDASSSLSRLSSTLPVMSAGSSATAPRHAHLLGDGHQQLERAVRAPRVLGERHHRRDRHAVVGAERRALGAQPAVVADDLDPPGARVVRAVRIALADDVEVALEDHRRRVLAPGRGGDVDDEVAGRVARASRSRAPSAHATTCATAAVLLVRRRAGSA